MKYFSLRRRTKKKSGKRKSLSVSRRKRKSFRRSVSRRKSVRRKSDGMVEEEEEEDKMASWIRNNFFFEKPVEIMIKYLKLEYTNYLGIEYYKIYDEIIFNYIKDYLVLIASKFDKLTLHGGACVEYYSKGKYKTTDLDYKLYYSEDDETLKSKDDAEFSAQSYLFKFCNSINKKLLKNRKINKILENQKNDDHESIAIINVIKHFHYSISYKYTDSKVFKIYINHYDNNVGGITSIKEHDKKPIIEIKLFYRRKEVEEEAFEINLGEKIKIKMTSKEFLLSQLKQNIGECRKLFQKVVEKEESKIDELNKHINDNPNFEKKEPDYKSIIEKVIKQKKIFFKRINEPSEYISKVNNIPLYETIKYIGCGKSIDQYNSLLSEVV